jgi:membrane protein YdbS with pleckstrin-like domain
MALRFQKKHDELDEDANENRRIAVWIYLFFFVVIAAIEGIRAWIRGETFQSYELDVFWLFLTVLAVWIASTVYDEFRIRTNGIYGKLKEIEDRLGAIERELNSQRYGN